MEEYTLKDFDLQKVKDGATIGFKYNDGTIIATEIVFYKEGENMYTGYALFPNQVKLYFFDNGELYNKDVKIAQAYIIESTITKTTGTKIARVTESDGSANAKPASRVMLASEAATQADEDTTEEIFSIATLQPREEIAMHCLESMLSRYESPLGIDNTKIKQLVSKSFLFAQEFINQAVLYREKETTSSTVESNKYAAVDSDSLSSDTDKLLFNICTALTNWMAQNKNQYADQQKNGLKLNTQELTLTTDFPDVINANISGSVKAEVSGNVKAEVSGKTEVSGSVTTKQETTSSSEK